jgi:penicillin amidase
MRWAGQDASDEILALYRLNHASSWDDMLQALTTFGVPGQNFIYGDVKGNIGYTAAGRIPIRSGGVSPQLPNDGSSVVDPWLGYVPFEQLPRVYNPPGGMIATANNKTVRSFPWHISSLWESDARISRIHQMLSEQPTFSAEDFMLMQMDVQSVAADTIRDAMVDALRNWPSRPVLLTRVMNRLAAWDCRMSPRSTPRFTTPRTCVCSATHLATKWTARCSTTTCFCRTSPLASCRACCTIRVPRCSTTSARRVVKAGSTY